MELKNRIIRFAVALTIAGAIATQIPMNGGIALARDGYGGRSGSGSTGRNIIRGVAAIAVGYGLYSTATAPAVSGGGGGASGGGGSVPAGTPTNNNNNQDSTESLWDVLNGRDDLNKFAQYADLAGLKEELRQPGEFTAFIPNNAAFADLGDAKIQELSKPENKAMLAQLLGNHIIKGKYTIDQLKSEVKGLSAGKEYPTINGKTVTVKMAGDVLTINDVRIIETDIPASNAGIHPIGRVIDPAAPATP
ncbi:MAG: fasciclin domain-containing protein [Capsulimonadales bacterium]|nr:fasciclin domain-containing protein [Capsulimonadales bacterium]